MAYTDAQGNPIPDEQVAQALAQGVDVRAVEGTTAWVVDPQTGGRREIAAEQLPDFLEWGFAPQSQAEAQQQSALEAAQDEPFQAFAEGAVRGGTLGLSDVAARQFAPGYADEMALRQQANPAAALTGGVAGAIVPGVLSGGAGLAGTAARLTPAGALARSAAAVGRGAESAVLRGAARLSEQALVRRGIAPGLARAAAMAAEGATEGAVASVGMTLSEASLGDQELTAEQLLQAGGMGAMLGGGIGAGLAGTGALVRRARGRGAAQEATEGAVQAAPRGLGGRVGQWLRSKAGRVADEAAGPGGVEARLRKIKEEARKQATNVAEGLDNAPNTAAGIGGVIPKRAIKWASKWSGIPEEDLMRVAGSRQIRSDALHRDELVQQAADRTRRGVEQMTSADHLMRSVAAGGYKRENIAHAVQASPLVRDRAMQMLSDFESRVNGIQRLTKTQRRDMANKLQHHMSKLQESKDGADLFIWADEFKRDLGRSVKSYAASARRGSKVQDIEGAQDLMRALDDHRESLRQWLESTDDWGQAAVIQREQNAAMRKMLDNSRDFRRIFTERSGEGIDEAVDPEAWMFEKFRGNGKGIKDFFNRALVDADADLVREQVNRHLAGRKELFETVLRHGLVPKNQVSVVQKALDRTNELVQDINTMSKRLADADLLHSMIAKESSMAGGAMLAGIAAGGFSAGPVGVAAGAAAGAIAAPGQTLMRIAKLEALWGHGQVARGNLAGKVDNIFAKWGAKSGLSPAAAGGAVAGGVAAGGIAGGASSEGVTPRVARKVTGKAAREVAESTVRATAPELVDTRPDRRRGGAAAAAAAGAVFGDGRKERRDSYDRIADRVEEYHRDPTALLEVIEEQTRELRDVAPGVAGVLAGKQAQALAFLASKMPPKLASPTPLQPHLEPQQFVSDADVDRMELYVRAVVDPTVALDDLADGNLRPETVEAVKAVWPAQYRQIQELFTEQLATTTQELPYRAMLQLGMLLDVEAHPTMTPQFREAMQQLQPAPPPEQAPPPQGPAPNYARGATTLTQQTTDILGG